MNYIFPFLAALLWGANTVVTKEASGHISPNEISFLRWLIATIVLTPFVFQPLRIHASVVKPNLGKFFLLGLLGGVTFQCLAYYAANFTTALNMGIIQALMPLMAIFLTSVMFRSMPDLTTILGALISLTGVMVVLSNGQISHLLSKGLNTGDGMMLLGVFAMAIYNVLLKRWHINVPLIVSLYLQAVAATVILLPIYLFSQKHALTLISTGLVLYSAIAASILAPLAWMAGSQALGPSRVSLFFNMIPIFTTVIAVILLSEPLSTAMLLGGGLTLAGVIFVEITSRSLDKPDENFEKNQHKK